MQHETFGAFAVAVLSALRSVGSRSLRLREIHWRLYLAPLLASVTWDELRAHGPAVFVSVVETLRTMRVQYGGGVFPGSKPLSPHYVIGIYATAKLLVRRAIAYGYLERDCTTYASSLLPRRRRDPVARARHARRLEVSRLARLFVASHVQPRFRLEYLFAFTKCAPCSGAASISTYQCPT